MKPEQYFQNPQLTPHKQYEALRAFHYEKIPAARCAIKFGYSLSSFYALVRDFKKQLAQDDADPFFLPRRAGRKPLDQAAELDRRILALRKKYLAVPEIKAILDADGPTASEKYIYHVIQQDGFARLPRRHVAARQQAGSQITLEAPKSAELDWAPETFSAQNSLGALALLPYLQKYGIDRLLADSAYPGTSVIGKVSSLLAFLALKLSHVRRYSADDVWCHDRGPGLFAGLNVLPKAAWFTSYSHRVTREMNRDLLRGLHQLWHKAGLLSDTANLDFTAVPYWGDDSHLENNWSGTRHLALPSILAVLAQDPDSGLLTYGDAGVRHENKSAVALEFLDFYRADGGQDLRYLVFDSQFTTYQNLARLDSDGVKFLTIRRRGKNVVESLGKLARADWKKISVPAADGKGRTLTVNDSTIRLRDYGAKPLRQIALTGHGRIKPALLLTNEFERPPAELIRKYARRWLVEKEISQQLEFFHLNRVSSSMVIKVDFDLTMSLLAHNLLRLLAQDLTGYEHNADLTLYQRFLQNSGTVDIGADQIVVRLKKKRHLPALLTALQPFAAQKLARLGNRRLLVAGETSS